jgi:hypothetical protein
MDDWLLRAWRAGISVSQGDDITVLRFLTHYQSAPGEPAYAWNRDNLESIERGLMQQAPDQIRSAVWRQVNSERMAAVPRMGFDSPLVKLLVELSPEQERLAERCITPAMADEYLRTGRDAYDRFCELAGIGRGWLMQRVAHLRTGEDRHAEPDYGKLLTFARQRIRDGA